MSAAVLRCMPIWIGPDHYNRLRAWCRANGQEVGPNGYVGPAAVADFLRNDAARSAATPTTTTGA